MSITDKIKAYFEPQSIDKGVRVRDVVRELPGAVVDVNNKSKENIVVLVFFVVWIGSVLITINAQVLGANM